MPSQGGRKTGSRKNHIEDPEMSKKILMVSLLACFFAMGCGDDSSSKKEQKDPDVLCGNGSLDDGEVCDDGNTADGDGCKADCSAVESGYECSKDTGKCSRTDTDIEDDDPDEPKSACGNEIIESGEACDDGNKESGDGCSADCQSIEDGFTCTIVENKSICTKSVNCGNSEVDDGEVCDDGNTEDGDGCSADCQTIEEGYICPDAGYDCVPEGCGNGYLEENEDCDQAEMNVEYGTGKNQCSTSCKFAHYCGDGLWDEIDRANGEECDSGSEDTSESYEGCSSECRLVNYCGDGRKSHEEQCDDGNKEDGDGCSAACTMEANFACVTEAGKSVCTPILCGNNSIDSGESCDDGNRDSGDGCSAICQIEKGYAYVEGADGSRVLTHICGDGVIQNIETGKPCADPENEKCEACDDGNADNGDGCSSICAIEAGYICPTAGKKCVARSCGDGIVAGAEECDDGVDKDKKEPVSGDGCSDRCKIETGFHCPTPGAACVPGTCGDGFIDGGETCDEGSAGPTEGCVNCQIQAGWKCETAGTACVATTCGDGILEGLETCEDSVAGCINCVLQKGWHCDADGKNCEQGTCGDGHLDVGEACDDGNNDAGDGCNPVCEIEAIFDCVDNSCKAICGDGLTLWQAGEECDDGNLISGDGCSSACKIEKGYQCTDFSAPNPATIQIPMTYRDFRSWADGGYSSGSIDGFLSQELFDSLPQTCKQSSGYRMASFPAVNYPLPDFQSYCEDQYCQNTVYEQLTADGKPVLRPASDFSLHPNFVNNTADKVNLGKSYTCPEVFDWWYRDIPGLNVTIHSNLTLAQDPNSPDKYHFASNAFFPIENQGYHAPGVSPRASNSGKYTSEFVTYFKYKGGEELIFDGDDDAWVFINDRKALDLGCMHVHYRSPIVLNEEAAKKLNIYPGGIYSIRMFHAERCSNGLSGSIYEVTLSGFVNMGKSTCQTVCGDGVVGGAEECDFPGDHKDENLQHAYGCSEDCRIAPWCGNGKLEAGEGCEPDETNTDWCIGVGQERQCQIVTCGDNHRDEHEQCDGTDGVAEGQVCLPTCRISGCGDGFVDASIGEECDDGNDSNEDACTTKCHAPYCGDGVVSAFLGEVCDDGINDGGYNGCGLGCTYMPPQCGDGSVDTAEGEECDDGKENNIGGYGRCNSECRYDARCGDGVLDEAHEQCDDGNKNGTAESSCSKNCEIEQKVN